MPSQAYITHRHTHTDWLCFYLKIIVHVTVKRAILFCKDFIVGRGGSALLDNSFPYHGQDALQLFSLPLVQMCVLFLSL